MTLTDAVIGDDAAPVGEQLPVEESRILVVDDDAHAAVLMRRLIEREGFTRVETASDGRRALAMMADHRPDVVVLDVHLPELDGFEVLRQIVADGVPADQITDELISSYLYTSGLPDPDLIIRTSGELRVSNFLIWQGAYSEYYASSVYWPDFDKEELRKALVEYSRRRRRFGKTNEQIESE